MSVCDSFVRWGFVDGLLDLAGQDERAAVQDAAYGALKGVLAQEETR